ncbi:MAG: hypothetical protein ACOY9Y_03410 [Bacillota bacterium]
MYKLRRVNAKNGLKKRNMEQAGELSPRQPTRIGGYGQGTKQLEKAFGSPRPDYELYPGE